MTDIPATMQVPHFQGNSRISLTVKEVPRPGPGQLLIEVKANALCGSERGQFVQGSEVTPGHEAAGLVAATGEGTTTPVGTMGAIFLMDFCSECRSCRAGFTNQCSAKRADMGFTHDGGYGKFELVHENIFFPSEGLSGAEATLLLDIMGTGSHAIKRGGLVHQDIQSVLVAGAGPIGLGVLAMSKLLLGNNIPVYIFDVNDYRLLLAEKLGGLPVSLANGNSLEEGLKKYGASSIDLAVDTTGKQVARQAMLNLLGNRGALVLVGHGEKLELNVSPDMIATERAVLGSEYFAFSEMENNLRLYKENRDYLNQIIAHRFGVGELQQAFELFFGGQTGKVVIKQ